HVPFYEEVMENPEDFPDGLVNVLYKDAFPIRYYTLYREIQVPKASTGITSKDLRDGNSNVVEANGSNSNTTSNAGAEVVLPTREEVPTSAMAVKSMAEKGRGGDEVVNSSAGDKKGATVLVSAKGKTNTMGSAVEEVETLKVKNPFMVFGDFKMEDLLRLGLKFNLTEQGGILWLDLTLYLFFWPYFFNKNTV
ncbi:hypothetical protein MKW92_034750, partial [Papaver armeniacum]